MIGRSSKTRRAVLVGMLAASLALGVATAPVAQAGQRDKLLAILNRIRDNHGLTSLKLNVRLSGPAKAHTRKMIRRGEIFDPNNLYDLLDPYAWHDVGADVVGCHDTLKAMVHQWMGEDFHRSIILHPKLRKAGIGVIRVDGKSACGRDQFWATAIMYG